MYIKDSDPEVLSSYRKSAYSPKMYLILSSKRARPRNRQYFQRMYEYEGQALKEELTKPLNIKTNYHILILYHEI